MIRVAIVRREKENGLEYIFEDFDSLQQYYATILHNFNNRLQADVEERSEKNHVVAINLKVWAIFPIQTKKESEIELFGCSNYLCEIAEVVNGKLVTERHFLEKLE